MGLLEEIVAHKRNEIAARKRATPKTDSNASSQAAPRSLVARLRAQGRARAAVPGARPTVRPRRRLQDAERLLENARQRSEAHNVAHNVRVRLRAQRLRRRQCPSAQSHSKGTSPMTSGPVEHGRTPSTKEVCDNSTFANPASSWASMIPRPCSAQSIGAQPKRHD